jgi:type VI secretion system protein ImpB
MDGKVGAEEVVKKLLGDPTLLNALASTPKPEDAKPTDSAS